MHICIGKLTVIASDNGLSPGRRQAIIRTNAGILLIGPLGTNFSEILIGIQTLSFKKMHLKMSSAKWRPFCLCLNVLRAHFFKSPPESNQCWHHMLYLVQVLVSFINFSLIILCYILFSGLKIATHFLTAVVIAKLVVIKPCYEWININLNCRLNMNCTWKFVNEMGPLQVHYGIFTG